MREVLQSIAEHGYLLLFGWVLLEQLGVPVPAMPILLAAGVLAGVGKLSFGLSVALAIAACVIGDVVWFWLGRKYGGGVVRVLCKLSLEPDSCVRKTSDAFTKHGPVALLFAKFVPGIGTVSVPLAGSSGVPLRQFALYDLGGAALYVLTFTGVGVALGDSIEKLDLFTHAGALGFWLVVIACGAIVGWRLRQRKKFLRDLNIARITPKELHALMQSGAAPFIVDLRHPLDFLPHPKLIPGALRILPSEVTSRIAEFPRDRDVILYCT